MASEAELTLITTPFSPYGQRVGIALKEKNIPFDQINIDLKNKPQILLEANPIHKMVPTIIHNGKPVAESLVILQYLEDAFPKQAPLLPTDAFEKSRTRFWTDYVDKTITAGIAFYETKRGSHELQVASEKFVETLKTIDAGIASFSAEGPFFTGDRFGLVDVVLAPICLFLPVLEELAGLVVPGRDEIPRLHQCLQTIWAHPSVSSILPDTAATVSCWNTVHPM